MSDLKRYGVALWLCSPSIIGIVLVTNNIVGSAVPYLLQLFFIITYYFGGE